MNNHYNGRCITHDGIKSVTNICAPLKFYDDVMYVVTVGILLGRSVYNKGVKCLILGLTSLFTVSIYRPFRL